MRPLTDPQIAKHCLQRVSDGGAYIVNFKAEELRIIASTGEGWDHVSVSLEHRVPNWSEMEFVKRMFFQDDEWAMQLHAPPSKHINCHPFVLHIWRPLKQKIPIPPTDLV